ncbi:MAG: DUF4339 domain-containing protein [Chthoniobacterales bacterium]
MEEKWIVRVQDQEFGPVDLETLTEWWAEGRLLPENPARRSDRETWQTAGQIEGLFPSAAKSFPGERARTGRIRTFSEIFLETGQIYWRGFPQFFCLALLVAVPSLIFQISLACVNVSEKTVFNGPQAIASAFAVVAFTMVLVAWPIFLGGLQIVAIEISAGRTITLRETLQRAISFWPRVMKLCLIVYLSFAFWTIIPFLAILSLVSAGVSIPILLLALLVLGFQVYMTARLFVNFLFWQQAAVIENRPGVEALIESRKLAHTRATGPRLQRPAYRGAIVASLWLLLLLAISAGVELPFLLLRLRGITSLDEATAIMQTLLHSTSLDWMTFVTYTISGLLHAALRPLLGIAFVVLYYDAKRDDEPHEAES